MIWKKAPHVAPEGEEVYVKYKIHKPATILKMRVSPNQVWSHIECWCYVEELEEFNKRKIKEKL